MGYFNSCLEDLNSYMADFSSYTWDLNSYMDNLNLDTGYFTGYFNSCIVFK